MGGRLGQLAIDGVAVLRGPDEAGAGWAQWGSYPMVPWCNRIPDGRFEFGGESFEVPVNWDDGSAIHGLAASAPWQVVTAGDRRVRLRVELHESRYRLDARQSYELRSHELVHRLGVTNRAPWPVPIGLGIHPWFREAPIRVPASAYWPGSGPMPDGAAVAIDGEHDLRVRRRAPIMDRCYTGLTEPRAEIGRIELGWSGPVTQVVVYSGVPGWVCVEPMTMVPNGFALATRGVVGTGVIVLAPGASVAVSHRFGWRPTATEDS